MGIIVTAEIDIAGIGVTLLEEIAKIVNRKGVIETTTDEIGKEIETKDVIEIVIEIEIVEKPGVIGIMIDTRTGKMKSDTDDPVVEAENENIDFFFTHLRIKTG